MLWRSLLGRLFSFCLLVPGGRLWVRSLQLVPKSAWDFQDVCVCIRWTLAIHDDLLWWSDERHLQAGVQLDPLFPNLLFWSDASYQGWGGSPGGPICVLPLVTCGASVNQLARIAGHSSRSPSFSVPSVWPLSGFSRTTRWHWRISVVRGGDLLLGPQRGVPTAPLLGRAVSLRITLVPQFIMGARNVVGDSLSRSNQVIGSEWILAREVVLGLLAIWPATIDLFAMALNYCLPVYFSPLEDPMSAGTYAFLQCWDNL